MSALTDRQSAILDFIRSSIAANGYPPTLREIGARVGIRSTNGVNDHLLRLEKKGFIARDGERARGIRLLGEQPIPAPPPEHPTPEDAAALLRKRIDAAKRVLRIAFEDIPKQQRRDVLAQLFVEMGRP